MWPFLFDLDTEMSSWCCSLHSVIEVQVTALTCTYGVHAAVVKQESIIGIASIMASPRTVNDLAQYVELLQIKFLLVFTKS